MQRPQPAFTQFLQNLSSLLASGAEPHEITASLALAFRKLLFVKRFRLVLNLSSNQRIQRDTLTLHASAAVPRLLFSSPLRANQQQLGFLAVEVNVPEGSTVDWMSTLETTSQLLALFAESIALNSTHTLLRAHRDTLRKELLSQKLLARAGGLLSRNQGFSQSEAEYWLATEANRRGGSVIEIAQQVIEHYPAAGRRFLAA
jgi:hypothetical protein